MAYVYVAADPTWKSLGDMPATRAIGATIGTSADMRLTQYLLAAPADKRWDKYPMSSDEAALRAVMYGTTGAALVWAPALWALRKTDAAIATLPEMAPGPLPISTADVGAILLRKQTFLRSSLDQAIASLTADGTIAGILKDANFPGRARAAMIAAIQLDHVGKRYGRTVALTDITFDVQRKELFALLGPNGAGKTTLLHILSTVLQPDSGTVRIGNLDVVAQSTRARRDVGVVFQDPSLDDRLTVYENLNFHGLVYGVPGKLRRQRIGALLELVELTEWQGRLVRTLSSGMKRRVEIARALVHDSHILFLDEPTVGLDAQSRARIWQYIHRLRQRERPSSSPRIHREVEDAIESASSTAARSAIDTPAALRHRAVSSYCGWCHAEATAAERCGPIRT